MTPDYETCRSNLEKLLDWYTSREGERNEATTRLQMIDKLFFDCLGWSRDDVNLEESYQGEYADYTFSAPRRILIVEAKREGNYFELPIGKERMEYSLPALMRDYANLKAAIEQVTGYCQKRGIPFAAVCNGHQLVVFVATRNDGLPPFEGKALVFSSLNHMLNNFSQFWNALSKPAVENKKLDSLLIGAILPQLPPKLSASIIDYPGNVRRNTFQTELQILSDLIIEDVTRLRDLESTFLEECYSRSGALSQYALISKTILQTRYAALFDSSTPGLTIIPAVNKGGISPELLAESLSRRPILLIGDVGVGKTTFIRHLIKVDAVQLFEKAISLHIDLGSQATLSSDLKQFIPEEIVRQLSEDYGIDIEERNFVRAVYHGEIIRFGKSIYSDLRESNPDLFREKEIDFIAQKLQDKEQHLKKSLEHIAKGQKKQIIVFLDNADQRTEETQQQAFLIAQEFAAHWPATVFAALRPETYYRSIKVGALSGYHPKAFTISPPRIDLVVKKRLQFALKLTSGEIPIHTLDTNVHVQLIKLDAIIRVFLDSLQYSRNLEEFIDNIVGGNVRLALDLIRGFFGSGHVDTEKIVERYKGTGSYYIPLHEFLRAVIFGDAKYYDPDKSPLANLFDVSYKDSKEHFLLPLVIGLLVSPNVSNTGDGFVEISKIYEQMQRLGFTPEQIDLAIIKAHNKKLIETGARRIPQPGVAMPQAIRATTIGSYHINRLCRYFTYMDAIVADVPFFDENIHSNITDVQHIEDRLLRADLFRQYLDEQWLNLKNSSAEAIFNWSSVSTDLKKDIDYVRSRI